MTSRARWLFIAITLFALIYNGFLPLHPDEAYYWTWSRHLAWSYYDAPPMVAYLIWLSTHLFGTSAFTVKLGSVLCITVGAYLIHQLTQRLFDSKTAEVALVITLLIPFVQAGYLLTTPDSPLLLFWTATLYAFYLALDTGKTHYFYLAGLCAGLMLLSKYTGVLLLTALFGYLIFSPQRRYFKNPHLYLAGVLALVVFSPVIIWNAQNHWVSFLFQWHHGTGGHHGFSGKYLGQFLGGQLGVFNPVWFVMMLVFVIGYVGHKILHRGQDGNNVSSRPSSRDLGNKNSYLPFLLWPFLLTWLFFFYQACFTKSQPNWPAPAYVSAIILLAYWLVKGQWRKTYIVGTAVSVVVIIVVKFPMLFPFMPPKDVLLNKFLGYQQVMQQAAKYYHPGEVVLSDSYQRASEAAFYLPDRPEVYIITPTRTSQITMWSQSIKHQAQQGNIPQALYIGQDSQHHALQKYFPYIKTHALITPKWMPPVVVSQLNRISHTNLVFDPER